MPSNFIFSVTEDNNGVFWAGSDKGLLKYENGKWLSFNIDNGFPGNYISALINDGNNGLFLGISEKGTYHFNTIKNKIDYVYSIKNITRIGVCDIDSNYIYIGVPSNGNNFNFYVISKKNPKKIEKTFSENRNIYINKNGKKHLVKSFHETDDYFETIDNLHYHLKFNKGLYVSENNIDFTPINVGNFYLNSIYKSHKNDLFISSLGNGIYVIKKHNNKIVFPIEEESVRCIQNNNGNYYVLAQGFVYEIIDYKINKKFYTVKDALTMLVDGETIYIGNFNGIYGFDKNSGKQKYFYKISSGISKILKNGEKLFFSTYGGGLYKISTLHHNTEFNTLKLPFINIENLFSYKEKYIATSYEKGFFVYNEQKNTSENFDVSKGLSSNYVTNVLVKDDSLFVSTKKGIDVVLGKKVVKKYNLDPNLGTKINLTFKDKKGKLWMVTEKNIARFTNQGFKPIGSLKLFKDEKDFISKAFYFPEKNQLAIATHQNFSIIELENYLPQKEVIQPKLMEIKVDNQSIKIDSTIEIPNNHKLITVIFNNVDRDLFSKSNLFFKINNDDWKIFKENNILKFYYLNPGNYTINIKTINGDGYEKLIQNPIKIKVLAPFWQRWWFVLAAFLLLSAFTAMIINYYNKEKYKRKLHEMKIQNEVEMERKRISRDLHDNIGAYANSLISKLDFMKMKNPKKKEEYEDLKENAESILNLLRQTIWVLNSKETDIETVFDKFKIFTIKALKNSKIKVNFYENLENNKSIDSSRAVLLIRVLQEIIQNILKHSDATEVEIKLLCLENFEITVKDNGKGFDVQSKSNGYGIGNMRYRAEEGNFNLKITSSENVGTEIVISEKYA